MSKQLIISLTLHDPEGNRRGKKRYAVTTKAPVVKADWHSNRNIPCQSDQSWTLRVWQRIEGRGYVASLSGSGQWPDYSDRGTYTGTGDTAEAALMDAWRAECTDCTDWLRYLGQTEELPQSLLSACQEYDCQARSPSVE